MQLSAPCTLASKRHASEELQAAVQLLQAFTDCPALIARRFFLHAPSMVQGCSLALHLAGPASCCCRLPHRKCHGLLLQRILGD